MVDAKLSWPRRCELSPGLPTALSGSTMAIAVLLIESHTVYTHKRSSPARVDRDEPHQNAMAEQALLAHRTHGCGELRSADSDTTVSICGWVDKYRNLGGLLFLDLRDHTGILQVVSDESTSEAALAVAAKLRQEWVVRVTGQLRQRLDVNKKMATGDVELVLNEVQVLNSVERPLPFPVSLSDEQEPPRCACLRSACLRHNTRCLKVVSPR